VSKKYNAANAEDVAEAGRKEAKQVQLEIDDLVWQMEDIRGRRNMWRLLGQAGVFRSSFTGNSTTFFNEGQRNIGLYYLNEIMLHCPETYLMMINEAQETHDG